MLKVGFAGPVNLTQLQGELTKALDCDPLPLRAVDGLWVACEDETIDPDVFSAVVQAHQADPLWVGKPNQRRSRLSRLLRRK